MAAGKITLNMTGEQFKQLIEQTKPDGVVDTLQEVLALFSGISDDETLATYVERKAKEVAQPEYVKEEEAFVFED